MAWPIILAMPDRSHRPEKRSSKMKIKFLVVAAAFGMALSTAAMAAPYASFTPNNRCDLYARDLNWNIMLMPGNPATDAASQALTQGQDECARGKFDDGIATLTGAIKNLGLPVNEY
jgi:hypothetical protein